MTKEEAKNKIAELLLKYEHLSASEIKSYHEAKTKQGFIEPLFRALGWDFDDVNEVTPEESASKGRVDYAFKLNGVAQFYVEAKPLRADLTNENYVKQTVTYAYNKGITWAILTDFHELRLFNSQSGKGWLTLNYADYASSFEKLWLLSRESLATGLLDKEASQWGALPVPVPVETRLFKQLRQWRADLFNELPLYNTNLSFQQVDEVIQRLFNRLIFIRTCEDRGIEEKRLRSIVNQWKSSGRKGELEEELRKIFREFDGYYDSDLFVRHLVDEVSIMSTTLESILEGLYEIPGGLASYDFSILDADVLGAVYEQYLGYVAQIVKQRAKEAQAKLDLGIQTESIALTEKKERRKEHGIYYTPKFVTDYIVKETVGRFLKERSYNEIRNIKILDPACGSGSFLIRAYDELLNYHAYRCGKPVSELDQWERLPILTRNIFGVDLDMQAVEIARLNLLLRSLAKRETLPSLADNIREGNSLISGTEEELKKYFGDNWRKKKAFNWEEEFRDIMAEGGFDVIIGNPPYVRPHKLETDDKQALWTQYQVYRAKSDIYACFIQRAIDLLKPGGYASYIVSNTFISLESFTPLRKYILDTCCVLYFGLTPKKVFEAATVETILLGLKKESNEVARRKNMVSVTEYRDGAFEKVKEIPQANFYSTYLNIFDLSWDEATLPFSSRIELNTDKLSEVVSFCYGLKTGDDTVFLTYAPTTPEHKRLLRRSDFGRFSTEYKREFVWYVPEQMRKHRTTARPGNRGRFERPKILVQDIGRRLVGTLDDEHFYVKDALMLHQRENGLDLKFVLALINSKLLNYWYARKFSTLSVAKNAILVLPVHHIDFNNPTEKKMHDDLVSLVDKMLELNKKLGALSEFEVEHRQALEKEIGHTDSAIDGLVYELYGLTEDEIKIVESQAA
jgi:type I restriction-modification system DNA methylase subunit